MSVRPPLPRPRMTGTKPIGAPKAGPVLKGKPGQPGGPHAGSPKPGKPKSC